MAAGKLRSAQEATERENYHNGGWPTEDGKWQFLVTASKGKSHFWGGGRGWKNGGGQAQKRPGSHRGRKLS